MQTELEILTNLRNKTLARETDIYNNEIDRIKNKQAEYHTATKLEYNTLLAEYMAKLSDKQQTDTEYEQLQSVIKQGQASQSEKQVELLRAIHKKNQLDRDKRNASINRAAEISRLDAEIASINEYISKYEDHRRQISEDYYNWLEDSESTTFYLEQMNQIITENEFISRPINNRILNKKIELERLALELATDPRQNQDKRYTALDNTITAHITRVKLLRLRKKHISELPVVSSSGRPDGSDSVELPPYFKEEIREFKQAKRAISEVKQRQDKQKEQLDTMLSELLRLSKIINNPSYLPDDLIEQRTRAIERLDIVRQRVASDIDIKIDNCRTKVIEAEKQRIEKEMGNKETSNKPNTTTASPAVCLPAVSSSNEINKEGSLNSVTTNATNTTKQSRRTNKYNTVVTTTKQ